jgi:hypothetical protein
MAGMRRLLKRILALAVLVASPSLFEGDKTWGERQAHAETASAGDDLAVGVELLAVEDVSMHRAELVKGARVSVTKRNLRDGRLESVSVALADGHVLKLPIGAVRTYFRVTHND